MQAISENACIVRVILLHQPPLENLYILIVTIENKEGARKLMEHLIEIPE
jgi:hypothetical protein